MGSYLLVMISQVLSKTKTKQAKDTSIINMKEIYIYIYIYFIKLCLRKSQFTYKRSDYITNEKQNSSKNRTRTIQDFTLITSLSLGVLAGWVVAAVEDATFLLFGSSLARMGRVTRTNSRLWEATTSLEVSLGAFEGFVILEGASYSLACSSPFWGLLGGGGSLDKALSVGWQRWELCHFGKMRGLRFEWQEGSIRFLPFWVPKRPQPLYGWEPHSILGGNKLYTPPWLWTWRLLQFQLPLRCSCPAQPNP